MQHPNSFTIVLGDDQAIVDAKLRTGEFQDASEVVRAGLHALEREEATLDEMMRKKVLSALANPQPPIPAGEVFDRLRAKYVGGVKPRRDAT
ncbi:hypothetical protein LCGC14_0331320 [marine sediment metagenome]|uniref:Type II toxin-antitoxin system ParD family antitoxin n=1 Tax=marine sediment metagenome TaxID=412755 RepID=A0A0F9TM46_9ZZZZ